MPVVAIDQLRRQLNNRSETRIVLQRHSVQCGVGLVEILLSIVILAIGFLAAASMQVTSMRYSQSAYFESQAYFMAGDMIARMRANVTGVKTGAYDGLETAAQLTDPQCGTKFCTPAQMAVQDRYDWSQNLHSSSGSDNFIALLPSSANVTAVGRVNQLSSGQYSVTISWADQGELADGTGTLRVDLVAEE